MYMSYSYIFALGCIVATASKVQIFPASIYSCRTSQKCSRYLRCDASEEIKWLYPNSTVITSTDNTAKIYVEGNNLHIILTHPMESDAGLYTCCLKRDSDEKDSVMLRVHVDPVFIYGSSPLHENKTALRYHDIFLNCSFNPTNRNTAWEFRPNHIPLYTSNTNKYAKNSSGLTIYNVTNDDQGLYVCVVGNINPLEAFILLNVTWSPQLLSQQNETIIVNISMQVILNCNASASPDPVYTWSFPDTCLSCPHSHHSNMLNFTAEVTNSGKYICMAENEYGNISKTFFIHVHSKPIMNVEHQLKIMEKAENIMLTCDIQYAYPTPSIEWNITTLSGLSAMKQNSNGNFNYKNHRNGSIEIFHRFLSEMGHIITLCSATNMHGYSETIFHLWEHSVFVKEQEFVLYIKNITDCHQIAQDTNGLLAKLFGSLRQWFNSTCNCDGYNNLYGPRLICLDTHTGNITSTVRRDHLSAAQELIKLTTVDIQMRDPPVVHLTNGWILCLNPSLEMFNPNTTAFGNDENDNGPVGLSVLITISVASFCTILALIFCITVGLVYIKHKREATTDGAVGSANSKVKANNKKNQENATHIYEEIQQSPPKCSKPTNDESKKLKDEVVFDAMPPPAYRIIATSTYDDNKFTGRRSNDYCIEEEDIGLNNKDLENAEGNCQTDKDLKFSQSNQTYSKLTHCDSQ